MNQTSEVATETVKAVWFSLLTDEEVRKHSFLKITEPQLLDRVDRPLPNGLYDPSLGPLDETSPCKTCGQRQFNCPGHFGHIDLVFPVYNPLLFNFLYNLLQRTCFFCHHFKAGKNEVEKCVSKLELIIKGDIVAAKRLDSLSESSSPEDSNGSHKSCSTVHSGTQYDNVNHLKQQEWTSLQSYEAKSVLQDFLKIKITKCRNCKAKNPSISKPTFGWIHMSGMSRAHIRGNIIRGHTIGESFAGEIEPDGEDSSDVDTAETHAFGAASPGTQDTTARKHQKGVGRVASELKNQQDLFSGPLLPSEAKNIVKNLWENEVELCSFISDMQQQGFGKKAGHYIFFLETILVPPIKFRLASKGGDSVMEHPQTVLLSKVLQCNIYLGNAYVNKTEHSKTIARWMDLQQSINVFFDGKTATGHGQRDLASGICQLLEKKEGLFRQKLMGKRVNFACRSVISPDPYLAVNEIGIPPYFALRLTYPERVTPWNVVKLRDAIINGSEIHPGATHYVDKLTTMRLPPNRRMRISISRKLPSSRGALMEVGKDSDYEFEGKTVYRHLQDGDVVLVNRQPTLHKPSIMAHVVRVLKGEKTLRMHYANCSTYNADFDGDEMNVHFPQDEISRAEAYNIVNANNQYVRPSNGDPLRALIQDHIVSAVLLTKKDTFLSSDQFNQLLYSSGVFTSGLGSFFVKSGQKVSVSSSEEEVLPLEPTIWKPEPLWTGKQVITAVLNHITRGRPPFTVERDGKIPQDFFKSRTNEGKGSSDKKRYDEGKLSTKNEMFKDKQNKEREIGENKPIEGKKADKIKSKRNELNEEKLLIFKNDFVRGVIDKAQFADYGLVHTVQELYGSSTAGILLSALSRLFTVFLQMHGFTCGVNDLLIREEKDKERKKQLEGCEKIGKEIHLKALQLEDDADVKDDTKVEDGAEIDPIKLKLKIEKTIRSGGEAAVAYFDRKMTGALNKCTSSGVINELLSEGLVKPTGKNCISLMTTSGAKGSKVNFQQISSHLGQQELEGKRVPRMVSGKTLPCFHPWDWTPRAGGFIIDRFLTGLRPQEYYFHCMAGREGLVDTAVKTSRSGYLQRCLIKNLESLKICYDHSVRDADGSIVQFLYGEDGVDVHQTSFITKFEALAANQDMIYKKCGDQLDASNGYITDLPYALKDKAEKFIDEFPLNERICFNLVKKQDFLKLLKHKFILSLAQPGEPVGLLASQSVGEPSTQMTLNTFHLAGRGEMNVTLGIPRLQEILTIASKDIKTPVMTCPLHTGKTEDDAKRLADKLKKITVADIVESMEVSVMPYSVHDDQTCSIYKLKMKLYKPKHYPKYTDISLEDWEENLEVVYVRELEDAIQNHMVLLSRISGIKNFTSGLPTKASNVMDEEVSGSGAKHRGENDDEADDEDGVEAEDLGLDAQKRKQQATDERDYEDGSEEELDEGASSAGFGSEIDQAENDNQHDESENEIEIDQAENDIEISKDEMPESLSHLEEPPTPKSSKKKTKLGAKRKKVRAKLVKKETDRAIYVAARGLHFEVHFKFINEPHILLAQIAQNTAKKVSIQSYGKIDQCTVTNCKENQVIYYGKDPKKRVKIEPEEKEKIPALHTAGLDFNALWQLQDFLDVRYIYSNNIQAMLDTYGVEAARETIIREINHVFNSYGISVNIRHLSLIADFMTHSGGYRPMSRLGGIAESVSPFSKMTFETASKFIVEAAYYGEVDKLETPSARICLGLPVKVGTGSFDLMQKLEV